MSTLLFAAAVATSANEATAQTVGLARVGPVDPATQYPLFYEDTNGLRLGLCRDPNACAFVLPGPGPEHYPAFPGDPATNWPDEGFYWSAGADMTGAGGARAILTLALESAFAGGSVAYQDNIVFSRVRIRLTGLVNGGTYIITHPYGVETLVAGVDGPLPGTINITRDVGIGAAMDFGQALHGDIGPFLVPVGFFGGFPGQLISDGATATTVTGSPNNTNYFRIQGPSANLLFPANASGAGRAQTNVFVLTGQVAPQLGAQIDKVTLDKSVSGTAVNIWASTAPGQTLAVSVGGSPEIQMQGGNVDGLYFARAMFGPGVTPSQVSVSNTSDFPPTTFFSTVATDTVEIPSAIYTIGGNLAISARTSDKAGNPVLTATAAGIVATAMTSDGLGGATASIGLIPGAVPPRTVQVTSAAGGVATANVVIAGDGAQGGGVPLVADAGADVTVASGAQVLLNGLASTGNIVNFSWTHDAGASIFLLGGNTATPSFFAPAVGVNQHLDIHFQLLIQDGFGGAAVDTMIVHVNGPVGPQDVVAISECRYTVSKNLWRVGGTNSLHQGQSVKIYLGAIGDRTRHIATVPVSATGTWLFFAPATVGTAPLATDTTVWVESTLVGTPAQANIRRL